MASNSFTALLRTPAGADAVWKDGWAVVARGMEQALHAIVDRDVSMNHRYLLEVGDKNMGHERGYWPCPTSHQLMNTWKQNIGSFTRWNFSLSFSPWPL